MQAIKQKQTQTRQKQAGQADKTRQRDSPTYRNQLPVPACGALLPEGQRREQQGPVQEEVQGERGKESHLQAHPQPQQWPGGSAHPFPPSPKSINHSSIHPCIHPPTHTSSIFPFFHPSLALASPRAGQEQPHPEGLQEMHVGLLLAPSFPVAAELSKGQREVSA